LQHVKRTNSHATTAADAEIEIDHRTQVTPGRSVIGVLRFGSRRRAGTRPRLRLIDLGDASIADVGCCACLEEPVLEAETHRCADEIDYRDGDECAQEDECRSVTAETPALRRGRFQKAQWCELLRGFGRMLEMAAETTRPQRCLWAKAMTGQALHP